MSVYGEIYRDATAAHAQPLHLQKFAPDDRAHEMAVRKLRKTAETQRTVRARFIMDDRTLICHKVSCERCKISHSETASTLVHSSETHKFRSVRTASPLRRMNWN